MENQNITSREISMKWWNAIRDDKSYDENGHNGFKRLWDLTVKHFPDRTPSSLTGREIEQLYNIVHNN